MALTGEADVSTDASPIPVHEPGRTSTDGDEAEPGEGDHCEAVDADPRLPEVPEPDTETDACGRPTSRFRRAARVALPLLIGVSAVIVVAGLAGDAGSMIHALESVDPLMVAVALLCEMASFAFLGLHLRLLGGPPANVRRLAPFRLALVVFGLGSVMPAAPAEGLVMAGRALRHRRLARRRTLLVLGVSQFFGTAGLYVLAAIDAVAVVALSDDRPLSARWLLLGGAVGAFGVVGVLAGILTRRRFAESVGQLAGRIRHPRHPAPRDERRARGLAWHDAAMHVVQERHNTAKLAVSILLGWALDGSCLFFALRAVGVHINFDVLLLAYSVGAAAAMIPLLPAGLGVVEVITPVLLGFYGAPVEGAVAGLLVYRALGTLLPATVGAGALAALHWEHLPTDDAVPAT